MTKAESEVLSQGRTTFKVDEKLSAQIRKVIDESQGKSGALIRVLQQVQGIVGYLPQEVLKTISKEMKVPLSEVYGIVSFYSFFSMVPKGKHIIQVCMGTSCYVKGGESLMNILKKDYGLEPGGLTSDGNFSLEMVRCLGCCGLSPVAAIGTDVFRRVKPSEINGILSSYR
jgi:NADP-reducing hydrogenase subunit HndA